MPPDTGSEHETRPSFFPRSSPPKSSDCSFPLGNDNTVRIRRPPQHRLFSPFPRPSGHRRVPAFLDPDPARTICSPPRAGKERAHSFPFEIPRGLNIYIFPLLPLPPSGIFSPSRRPARAGPRKSPFPILGFFFLLFHAGGAVRSSVSQEERKDHPGLV